MPEGNTFREQVRVWARRYLPAELASYAVTLPAISAALALTDSSLVAAVVGTWVEFLVYYATIAWCTLRDERLMPLATLRTFGALLVEFGPAELLDSFVVRPSALYLALSLAPHPAIGAIAGKLAADAVFYLFTILSYELLRRARADSEAVGAALHRPSQGVTPPSLTPCEILLDDARRFAIAASAAGVAVTLEVWPGMTHGWHTVGGWLPETRTANNKEQPR